MDEDTTLIKWVNDIIVPLITQQYLKIEIVHNEAACDIGYNLHDVIEIPNNATLEQIENILNTLKENNE